jgi:hypothetical protein
MIDPRKIATLGIGYGGVAIVSIGIVPFERPAPLVELDWGRHGNARHEHKKITPTEIVIPINYNVDESDEEQVIIFVVTELIRAGII